MLCLGQAAAAAAVLATAAGLWQALGLTHSAAAATGRAGDRQRRRRGPPVPSVPAQSHAAAAQAAASGPEPGITTAPRLPRCVPTTQAVGHAHVVLRAEAVPGRARQLDRGGGHRDRRRRRSWSGRGCSTPIAPTPIGGQVSASPGRHRYAEPDARPPRPLPPPVAFADNTADGSDPDARCSTTTRPRSGRRSWRAPRRPMTRGSRSTWAAAGTWTGLSITPRQGGSGFPRAFRLESSDDNVTWTPIPGQTYNSDHPFTLVDGRADDRVRRSRCGRATSGCSRPNSARSRRRTRRRRSPCSPCNSRKCTC